MKYLPIEHVVTEVNRTREYNIKDKVKIQVNKGKNN
jgi:hypothetical protein